MHRRFVFVTALVVVIADQATKFAAVAYLDRKPSIEVIGKFLQLTLVRNPGAAFSFGTGQTWIFSLFSIAVSVWIITISGRLINRSWAIAAGAVLGGALGNLSDRIFRAPSFLHGHVIDFIALPNYPVFNLADSAVVCAAVGMTVLSLRGVEYFAPRVSLSDSHTVSQSEDVQS